MPTWAIILLVFMVLLSIESIFKGYYNMRSYKDLSLYVVELEKRQAFSIDEGLKKAENQYREMQDTGDFHNGETFIFSECVSAVVVKKSDGIYFDIYIEKANVSKYNNKTETKMENTLKSSRLLMKT